jgi:hypothetical protein
MKKLLLSIVLILLSSLSASAIYFDDDGIQQGYRGFADFSYTLGVGDWGKNHDRIGIMTSHGYQIAPQFFAGVGVGFNYYFNGHDELCSLPVFAHFRSDILDEEITPYIDLRVGYSLIDVKGVYINPSVGCRFELTDDIGLNVGVGYTMQQAEYIFYYGSEKKNCGGIDFRVGIDF